MSTPAREQNNHRTAPVLEKLEGLSSKEKGWVVQRCIGSLDPKEKREIMTSLRESLEPEEMALLDFDGTGPGSGETTRDGK